MVAVRGSVSALERGRRALIYLADMHRHLEGCDWCCGGGDQIAEKLLKEIRKARRHGLKQRCRYCMHHDSIEQDDGPSPWGGPCIKCRDYNSLFG